jgi:heme oxygenase-like protein
VVMASPAQPPLPEPRGPISDAVLTALRRAPGPVERPNVAVDDALADDDLQLALYCCYELHYRSFRDVDPFWEWNPDLIAARERLEYLFEDGLRESLPAETVRPPEVEATLRELVAEDDGPPLARTLERRAGIEQFREFAVHRSAYQLKEADPHSWAVPRLSGRPKEALVEVQADEYGGGRPGRMHATLFANAMRELGLDSSYGAYLDRLPGSTLATVNLMSLFGLHRRLRGAIVGHLALFEMTSSVPNRRYASGLRRLGYGADACLFFDVHVVADAVHESVAAVDLAGGLARQDPKLGADVLWGARALLEIDGDWARHMMAAWEAQAPSLRPALALR